MSEQQNCRAWLKAAPYIDVHCHRSDNQALIALISIDLEADSERPSTSFYSAGIHPWNIGSDWAHQLDRLENHPRLLAIGECGLDSVIAVPMDLQISAFERQIVLATQWRKPLIIHCVRAFNQLIAIKQRYADHAKAWIVHGCNSHPELVKQLLAHGFYLSFGKALLNPGSRAVKSLPLIPVDKLFLETDAADTINIDAVYAAAAKIINSDVDSLKRQLASNFQRVFLDD